MKVLILGTGMQGKATLYDLVKSSDVKEIIAADKEVELLKSYVKDRNLDSKIRCEYLDAKNMDNLSQIMSDNPDVIIDLLPRSFVDDVTTLAVKKGISLVNSNYTTPKMKELATEAKEKGIVLLPEFGLDPGLDLVLLGQAIRSLRTIESIYSYGAGIPELEFADNPLKYKVTWTFEGVLKAYLRPACLLKQGKIVTIKENRIFYPENIHEIEIDSLGKLEAYPNGDALKYTEILGIKNSGIQDAGRYALRWPGHVSFWKKIVDLHLLDDDPVIVDGVTIDRKRFLAAVIEPHIRLSENERDIALVRIEVIGTEAQRKTKLIYQIIDRRDLYTGLTAMSRTVGFTASIGAQLIGTGKLKKTGLLSPVNDIPYDLIEQELSKREIFISTEKFFLD